MVSSRRHTTQYGAHAAKCKKISLHLAVRNPGKEYTFPRADGREWVEWGTDSRLDSSTCSVVSPSILPHPFFFFFAGSFRDPPPKGGKGRDQDNKTKRRERRVGGWGARDSFVVPAAGI